jgi:RND family efflux transporter MFP subunit
MFRKKVFWIILAVLVLGGGGYAYYAFVYQSNGQASEQVISTAEVRQGDIVISVSGSGTLVAAAEVDLGFGSNGYLELVNVKVGDQVQAGDVLAQMETDDLEMAIVEAETRVRLAQLDLDDVLAGPTEAELADAEAAIQNAQTVLTVARYAYDSGLNSDYDSAVRAQYLHYLRYGQKYLDAQKALSEGKIGQGEYDDALNKWRAAEADLNEAIQDADMEQLDAANTVDQARNNVYQALIRLDDLKSGATEEEIRKAQLALDEAQLALDDARAALEAATLCAPFDGTVVAVDALPGQYVSQKFITLADLEEPRLQFWVEEADMESVKLGRRVEVYFDSLPDDVFEGEIVQVNPALVTQGNTLAVEAWASVEVNLDVILLGGMNGDVEVISAESRDTLLVPLQALRELGEGMYAVFVVRPDGELVFRPVEVGIQDFTDAEILSGLEAGELVSVGVQENVSADVPEDGQQMPAGPGSFILEGGGGPGGGPP